MSDDSECTKTTYIYKPYNSKKGKLYYLTQKPCHGKHVSLYQNLWEMSRIQKMYISWLHTYNLKPLAKRAAIENRQMQY